MAMYIDVISDNIMRISIKEHPPRFTRGYGSYKMRTFNPDPLQCFNCQTYGYLAISCIRKYRPVDTVQVRKQARTAKGRQTSHRNVRIAKDPTQRLP